MLGISHVGRKSTRTRLVPAVLLACLLGSGVSAAQAEGLGLFSDADVTTADMSTAYNQPSNNAVARSRYVNIDLTQLPASLNTGDASKNKLDLNLFADVSFTGVVNKVQKDSALGTAWIGTLEGVEGGYFYLVKNGKVAILHVASPKGIYEVSWAGGDNLYKVVEIDQTKMEDHPPGVYENLPVGNAVPKDQPRSAMINGTKADSAARIDIMVVYTEAARAAEGSTDAMLARIALAVTETNESYHNSGVTTRLRLVHTEEVSYTESGDIFTDVNRLKSASDGYMDNVHSLRSTYGADMVGLIVENGGGYCGVASTIMATAATAFQVTARDCATGYYSFGHEFGHLQGARHDVHVDTSTTPYPYGHGYTYPAGAWRTIMAYNDACVAAGTSCTRLQYWSNPYVLYSGVPAGTVTPTGNETAKNYLVLNNTDYTVANFKPQQIASNFYSDFNSSASGWAAASGAWSIGKGGYYTSPGVVNKFASVKHTGKYGDLTYEVKMMRTGSNASYSNGLVLRGNPSSMSTNRNWKSSYQFFYTNDGSFSVWKVSNTGTVTALQGWTASSAISSGWNKLKVVAVGSLFNFYINDTLVWSGSDSSYRTGQAGVMFYRDSVSTSNRLYIDSAWLANTPTSGALIVGSTPAVTASTSKDNRKSPTNDSAQ